MVDPSRTIVAISSGVAPAPRAIVRISGEQTSSDSVPVAVVFLSPTGGAISLDQSCPSSTCAMFARLPATEPCERTLPVAVYWWPNARSFTGEPCAEIHLVGSPPLVDALVEHTVALGAHPAERGEFTLRSFLAGKLDLTQAEAVLGVIEADTTDQLSIALGQLAGNISAPVRRLRERLMDLTAHVEAGLDFVDEDIEFITAAALVADLESIRTQLQTLSPAADLARSEEQAAGRPPGRASQRGQE